MTEKTKFGQLLRAIMENKNSEKKPIVGSNKVKLQDEETTVSDIVIIDDKEDNCKGIRNNGCQNISEDQIKNDLKKPNSRSGKNLAINIKQENLAINNNDSPTDPSAMDTNTDGSTIKNDNDQEDNKLKYSATLAEMEKVREENERLKFLLARILKDYQSLQSHFFDLIRNQEANNNKDETKITNPKDQTTTSPNSDHHDDHDHGDHHQLLVSLSLGRTSSSSGTINDHDDHHEPTRKSVDQKKITKDHDDHDHDQHRGEGFDKLALALGQSSADDNGAFDDDQDRRKDNDDEAGPAAEMWPPSKALKAAPRPSGDDHEDGASQMSPLKKARVSVRARCDTPTMNDGCQWRKYGQKISKGNPCPRAYYRCTVSQSCPVRKQVQRCSEDMSILITTYEGTHNHPLPISATAMASTTAAAASMLQSRSTASAAADSQPAGPFLATSSSPLINNFSTNYSTNPLLINRPQQQFYFPNTSISTCNSHPTVTLDLTLPNPNSNIRSVPRYSATCLSFSSSSSPSSLDLPIINNTSHMINNGYGFNNYGNSMSHARNYPIGSSPLVINNNGSYNIKQPYQDANSTSFYQLPYNNMLSATNATTNHDQQSLNMTETIAAATKAIASNPKFQSALAAALTSFVGNGGGGGGGSSGV